MGDVLVVGVNSDASVRSLKGPGRPVISEIGSRRDAGGAGLRRCGRRVRRLPRPHRLLEALRPNVLVKGGTYAPHEVVGREVVEAYGGEIRVTSVVDGISTTRIVESLSPTMRPRRRSCRSHRTARAVARSRLMGATAA